MRQYLILLVGIVCCLLQAGCTQRSDDAYIKSGLWSLESGYGEGDFIDFDESGYYKLKGDTLFRMDKALAVISRLDRKEQRLYLYYLHGNRTGVYYYHNFFEE